MEPTLNKKEEFFRKMLINIANYQFGFDVGEYLFPLGTRFIVSKYLGRPKQVLDENGAMIATLDTKTGTLHLHKKGAIILHKHVPPPNFRVYVNEESYLYAKKGFNVFCKHVKEIDKGLRVGFEVLVVNQNDELAAVGKLAVPPDAIPFLKRGVAVKVRWGISE